MSKAEIKIKTLFFENQKKFGQAKWALVVAQLVGRPLLTPAVHGSNAVISFIFYYLYFKNMFKKTPGIDQFKKLGRPSGQDTVDMSKVVGSKSRSVVIAQQSGQFRHQRSTVRIQSSTNLLPVNCIKKTRKNRPSSRYLLFHNVIVKMANARFKLQTTYVLYQSYQPVCIDVLV